MHVIFKRVGGWVGRVCVCVCVGGWVGEEGGGGGEITIT